MSQAALKDEAARRNKAERDKAGEKAAAEKAASDQAEQGWYSCESLLVVRDRHGNAINSGGSSLVNGFLDFDANLDVDVDSKWLSVEDRGDGTYLLKWGAAAAGSYHVFVKLDGMHVLGSPTTMKLEL